MPKPLTWPDCRNVRDLGGLTTADGVPIRAGALIRADSLERLTAEGMAAVRAAGIVRIVDLRNVDEAEAGLHPFRETAELYRLIPMIDPAREPERDKSAERTLADIYRSSLIRNAKSIVDGVAAVADAPDGAVLVHCFAGKDRTGMVVALALSVAGVADEQIAADYAYSDECLQDWNTTILADITDEALRRKALERMSARPETMLALLGFARERFGGAAEYLAAHGMSPSQLERLRARLRDAE
jgi:protein tyrosine/serine phosphatase